MPSTSPWPSRFCTSAFATDERFAARLRLEAKAASRLDHPNSVRVIDFGEEPDGLLYIAMELLDGLDLFQTLERSWPIPDSRTVDLLCQTLSALAVAHDMGIVHRDLKPENIMLLTRVDDEGRPRDIVKVCDFGIAKTPDSNEDAGTSAGRRALTTQGMLIGTPEYMSPEQCRGQHARRAQRPLLGRRHPVPDPHGARALPGGEPD